jgi:hypothetical protein
MKRTSFIMVLMLTTALAMYAQTSGTLSVTATTSNAGGNYAPRNIVAIWIENEQGVFVKTLLAYAQNRITHLNTWEASTTAAGSPFNRVDAITGATQSNHAQRSCTWNGTDVNGSIVPDGTYRLRMELTDKNNTGNFSTFTFTKGPNQDLQTPANVPSFSSISISWEPSTTSIEDHSLAEKYRIFPNPTSGLVQVSGENITGIQVLDHAANMIGYANSLSIDLGSQPNGIYLIRIITTKGVVTKKVVKK